MVYMTSETVKLTQNLNKQAGLFSRNLLLTKQLHNYWQMKGIQTIEQLY